MSSVLVEFMGRGASPEEACILVLEKIAAKTKLQPHLLNSDGAPRFGLEFYALNKKGEFGSASMWSGGRFAVHDGKENKHREAAYLFKRNR